MLISSKTILFACMAACVASCGEKPNDTEVSGPSFCREISQEKLEQLQREGGLDAARLVRDYYTECDLAGKHFDDAIHWAEIAAKMGNQSDAHHLDVLMEASGQKSAP